MTSTPVGRCHQHQPQFGVQPPGDRRDARPQVGPHHPDQFDQRPEGTVPGRADCTTAKAAACAPFRSRARTPELASAAQHGVARSRGHRHGGGAGGSRRRPDRRRRSAHPRLASPKEIAYAVASWSTNRPAGSPAPTWTSTAALWGGEAARERRGFGRRPPAMPRAPAKHGAEAPLSLNRDTLPSGLLQGLLRCVMLLQYAFKRRLNGCDAHGGVFPTYVRHRDLSYITIEDVRQLIVDGEDFSRSATPRPATT